MQIYISGNNLKAIGIKDIPNNKPEICGWLRDKARPYYLTLNRVEFAYG